MAIREALQAQRRVLLDLTYRNRLLNVPRTPSSRTITVHDEISALVLGMLMDGRALGFAPLAGGAEEEALSADEVSVDEDDIVLPQPEDEALDADGNARRHTDNRLQTKLKSGHLQKRLLEIYYEARTMLEEQGINVLYLALGQLRFRERAGSEEFRSAPLLLVPVMLERKSARDRFVIRWNEEDPQENLSLREKLRVEFGLRLPDFPEPEQFDIDAYFAAIRSAVASQPGWTLAENAIQLGFFSFAKLLMFLDLDPARWPEDRGIDTNPIVAGLLGEGFAQDDAGLPSSGSCFLDALIPASELKHIVDCDSSQALAIETVRRGSNLVIQGPHGTGKSQTIANLIAAAVCDGKKVLFVAEKMAALEVVKRRLENVGLGALCLELHSNKANKKAVLEELGRTLSLTRPADIDASAGIEQLEQLRSRLNDHAQRMHAPHGVAQWSPYAIVGELMRWLPRAGRPDYALPDAPRWTRADLEARLDTVRALCDSLSRIGDPAVHPWRGVTHPQVMRPQAEQLTRGLRPLVDALARLVDRGRELATLLGQEMPVTCNDIERHVEVGARIAAAPDFDRGAIASAAWSAHAEFLRETVRQGRILDGVRTRRAGSVAEVAWGIDWTPQRMRIASKGRSLFRWLSGGYREAVAQLRSVVPVLPRDYAARIALLDDLIAGHRAQAALRDASVAAASAFGKVWRGADTQWDLAASILEWVDAQEAAGQGEWMRGLAAAIDDRRVLSPHVEDARDALSSFVAEVERASAALRLDPAQAWDGKGAMAQSLDDLSARIACWPHAIDALLDWMAHAESSVRAADQGLVEVQRVLASSPGAQAVANEQFHAAYFLEMLDAVSKAHPDLPRFDGRRHDALVEQFRAWDRKRLSIAQVEAARVHFDAMPKATVASVGTLGTLKSEIARKRGHMALRKLFRICGSPIQAAKPVFMMSPLSVAQFLDPGAIEFDLLVIDEASQVEPVDALGAIARCRQIVVVGDDRQLPPTSFFSRIVGDEADGDGTDGAQAKDLESVLSLCAAKGLPQRMLQWHYRSRHESLIAVSNKEFYEGRLYIVPSPDRERSHAGLRFHHLPDGRFDRGNSYKNHAEAEAIARAVVEHARQHPDLTLGVGAMSVRQRQAISDELEIARRRHPELERFVALHPHEPFFVKNLENIQGDERDVIFISIGYGRSRGDDRLYQNFGPLNADGGQRRLNVLISRARLRCEVFSSITAEDIRVDERTKHGVIALKAFLRYAQSGDLGIPVASGRAADSPFEASVRDALVKRGYQVDARVGVAGFFIDLAVVDPDRPGRYLLGVECDGATYHAAASARDRDRLRQEILGAHGWTLHRIWSTDWFQREAHETERLLAAIEAAIAARTMRDVAQVSIEPPASVATIRREDAQAHPSAATTSTQAYRQACFVPDHASMQPHEVPVASMAGTVERIIDIEGPIHAEEVVARVRDLWGRARAGSRIQEAVDDALRHPALQEKIVRDDDFHDMKGRPVAVRDRSQATSRTLRRPDLLPPQEIRQAIIEVARDAHGIRRDEVAPIVARMLGFQATSQQLRDRIVPQIDALVADGTLVPNAGVLTVPVR